MVRSALWLIVKLVFVSVALFILWQGAAPGLGSFWTGGLEGPWLAWQKAVLRWFYHVIELDADVYNEVWWLGRGYVLSVIPFLGLMIVAGPATLRKWILRVLLGLIIIGCWQVMTPLILYFLQGHSGSGQIFYIGIFPVFMFSYALPFILWVVFARDRIERWFSHVKTTNRQPSGK